LRCEAHGGFGRRFGETHRRQRRQGAPDRPHYDKGFEARTKLASDIAAFANTPGGGVLILGLYEDRATSAPAKANPLPLTDALRRDYQQSVAQRVEPAPDFHIHFVEDPATVGHGFVVIDVPPSLHRPHGVIGRTNLNDGTTTWPVRVGTSTIHLNPYAVRRMMLEMEETLAQRSRARDALERGLVAEHFSTGHRASRLVVTLMPNVPGGMELNRRSIVEFTKELTAETLAVSDYPRWRLTEVWPSGEGLRACAVGKAASVFAYDGIGVVDFALEERQNHRRSLPGQGDLPVLVSPGEVLDRVLHSVMLLARHALHRAGTRGRCAIRVRLLAAPAAMPGAVLPPFMGVPEVLPVSLDSDRGAVHVVAEVEGVIEDLVEFGPPLVVAVHPALQRISHAFGEADSRYTTSEGALVQNKFAGSYFPRPEVYELAARHGVDVAEHHSVI
ncbi:helix-turn-helix domain-containing protein, partial [Kitasatospora sp. NPDC088134]|uniref:AlbA family DNA-binding domain-containing protein n=1 Tax=Kitasatospora sp. NPDC088134 TaxID=3364071 RepID=UPI00382F4BF8